MCQLCVDAIKKHWPDLPESDWSDLLWECTAFPCNDGEGTAKQIEDMAKRSGCNLGKAMAIADDDTTRAMEKYQKENPNEET